MKKALSIILVVMMLFTGIATVSVSADTQYSASEWDGTTKDTSWYNPDSTTKKATLYNAAQLAGFAEISKTETFNEWTIKLGTDIVRHANTRADRKAHKKVDEQADQRAAGANRR